MLCDTSYFEVPRVEFLIKPTIKDTKFRYDEKGRGGTPIYGEVGLSGQRPNPKIVIYSPFDSTFSAIILVSCFTDDINGRHRPHPHKIIKRHSNRETGVCKMEVKLVADKTTVEFNDIFLVRTNEKKIWEELDNREKYITECGATFSPLQEDIKKTETFDLHVVRICFQVVLRRDDGLIYPLALLFSDPILDFQAFSDINILEMCPNEGKITGGTKIMLILKRIKRSDMARIFFVDEEKQIELPARMTQDQPYVLSNGYGVLICYSPEFSIEQSLATKSFVIKVKINDKETRPEHMNRYFKYRRILYIDSVYSDETHDARYLNLIRGKPLYKGLIDVHNAIYGDTKKENTKTVHQNIINHETMIDQIYPESLRQNKYYDWAMCNNQSTAPTLTPFSDSTSQDNSQNYVDSNIPSTSTEGYFTANSNNNYPVIFSSDSYHNDDGSFTEHQPSMIETNQSSVQLSYPDIQINHTQNYCPNQPYYDNMKSVIYCQDPSVDSEYNQNSTTLQEILYPSYNDVMEFDDFDFSLVD